IQLHAPQKIHSPVRTYRCSRASLDILFACSGPVMTQCKSKVFFPDDPTQPPQFNDCPRQAETTRRTAHSVMKLCATCASVWDEQDGQIVLPVSRQRNVFRQFDVCFQTGFGVSICET